MLNITAGPQYQSDALYKSKDAFDKIRHYIPYYTYYNSYYSTIIVIIVYYNSYYSTVSNIICCAYYNNQIFPLKI